MLNDIKYVFLGFYYSLNFTLYPLTQCEMCGKEFVLSQHLRSHIIQDHQWGVFTCHICLYVLFHPDELSTHMMEIHKDEEGGGIAKCPHCKEDIPLAEENMSVLLDHYK